MNKCNIFKLIAGVIIIGILCYLSVNSALHNVIRLLSIIVAVVLVFLLVKHIPFMKEQENTWVFAIVLIASIPINIRISSVIANWYLEDCFLAAIFLLACVIYMCLLSAEEILMGLFTRMIWPKQNETYLYATLWMDEEELEIM